MTTEKQKQRKAAIEHAKLPTLQEVLDFSGRKYETLLNEFFIGFKEGIKEEKKFLGEHVPFLELKVRRSEAIQRLNTHESITRTNFIAVAQNVFIELDLDEEMPIPLKKKLIPIRDKYLTDMGVSMEEYEERKAKVLKNDIQKETE